MNFRRVRFWTFLALIVILVSLVTLSPSRVSAQSTDPTIYLFWGEGCPYCEMAKTNLQPIAEQNPRIGYQEFEIYNNLENRDLFMAFAAAFGMEPVMSQPSTLASVIGKASVPISMLKSRLI
jgi:thiol-disulfide isomerase/thioredoxin